LISALGGALSLYLGISIAMVFEVIELVIDFVINLATRGKGKNGNEKVRHLRSTKFFPATKMSSFFSGGGH
jgi:hypothetical protein